MVGLNSKRHNTIRIFTLIQQFGWKSRNTQLFLMDSYSTWHQPSNDIARKYLQILKWKFLFHWENSILRTVVRSDKIVEIRNQQSPYFDLWFDFLSQVDFILFSDGRMSPENILNSISYDPPQILSYIWNFTKRINSIYFVSFYNFVIVNASLRNYEGAGRGMGVRIWEFKENAENISYNYHSSPLYRDCMIYWLSTSIYREFQLQNTSFSPKTWIFWMILRCRFEFLKTSIPSS